VPSSEGRHRRRTLHDEIVHREVVVTLVGIAGVDDVQVGDAAPLRPGERHGATRVAGVQHADAAVAGLEGERPGPELEERAEGDHVDRDRIERAPAVARQPHPGAAGAVGKDLEVLRAAEWRTRLPRDRAR